MEQTAKCKSLVAVYKDNKLMLDGPHEISFDVQKDNVFHIGVEQFGIRKITITSDKDVPVMDLYELLSHTERLLMLLDGTFITLSEIQLSESNIADEKVLHSCEEELMNCRLSYFSSAGICNYCIDKMMGFDFGVTAELFHKWEKLLDELDIVHQVYLYSLSDNGMPADLKCAFLIELAEPLVEIIKEHTNLFPSLKPGAYGTTLKDCLKALIDEFGADIFEKELSYDYNKFLSTLVNSRVRIMHIKRKQEKPHFNGSESNLYSSKISLLYRKIMFDILGFSEADYSDNLKKCVSELNEWNEILGKFLLKLSNQNT